MPITRDDAYYDHQRDLRKHEPRLGDNKGLDLLAVVEGMLAVPAFVQAWPLSADLMKNAADKFRSDNGIQNDD
jgi:hypothetical protein